jgi:hypothetical protein
MPNGWILNQFSRPRSILEKSFSAMARKILFRQHRSIAKIQRALAKSVYTPTTDMMASDGRCRNVPLVSSYAKGFHFDCSPRLSAAEQALI